MKNVLIAFTLVLLFSCNKKSENFNQEKTIRTELGLKKIYKTKDGRSLIKFTNQEWDSLYRDLRSGQSLNPITSEDAPSAICVTIATKKSYCKKGIGFACGVFDCPPNGDPNPNSSSQLSTERVQPAELVYNENEVNMIFFNEIDWNYLDNN